MVSAAAAFQQPFREVGALPQLGDLHVDGAGAGVEVAVPVAVATVHPVVADRAVAGATDLVGVGGHQLVDERAEHLPQQVG